MTAPPLARRLVLEAAARLLGAPYVWGGLTSGGVDCSGLTHLAYRAAGLVIPRDANSQFLKARPVRSGKLQPGDLLFLTAGARSRRVNHVMLYAGDEGILESRICAGKALRTSFPERFGLPLSGVESGGLVRDLTQRRPAARRIHFGAFLD